MFSIIFCKVLNISYQYKDKNLKIQKAMKLELLTRYKEGKLSLNKLKEFGVNTIRNQRYMPTDLSKYINSKNFSKNIEIVS